MKIQSGFTIIELLATLLIVSTIVGLMVPMLTEAVDEARYKRTWGEVSLLLKRGERARRTVQNRVLDAGPPARWVYTYQTLAAGSSVSDLEAAIGAQVNVEDDNIFGFPYQIEVTATYTEVIATVPDDRYIIPEATSVTANGANWDVTFRNNQARLPNVVTGQNMILKNGLYLENGR